MRRAAPPTIPRGVLATGMTYKFLPPSRVDSKPNCVPSGENAERRSSAGCTVNREHGPPSIPVAQRSPAHAKTTVEPSGDMLGYSGKPTVVEGSAPGATTEAAGCSATDMGAGAEMAAQPPARRAEPKRTVAGNRVGCDMKWRSSAGDRCGMSDAVPGGASIPGLGGSGAGNCRVVQSCGKLPTADLTDAWISVAMRYSVGFRTLTVLEQTLGRTRPRGGRERCGRYVSPGCLCARGKQGPRERRFATKLGAMRCR
jgi:hypothetical protein